MRYYVILALAILLSGCHTTKKVVSSTETRKDSVATTIEYRNRIVHDSIFSTREIFHSVPDSATIQALLECDSTGNVLLRQIEQFKNGKYINQNFSITDNRLVIKSKVDSMAIYREFYQRFHKSDDNSNSVSNTSVSKKENSKYQMESKKSTTPFWYYLAINAFCCFCGFFVGRYYKVIVRLLRKLFAIH